MKKQVWAFFSIVLLLVLGTAAVSAFQDPYGLSGHTFNEGGTPLVGTNITFTNQRTGEKIYFDSVAGGEYAQDCLNFPSAYEDGDVIQYYCVHDGLTNTTTAPINTSAGGGTSLDIYLSAAAEGNASVTVTDGSITFGNLQLNAVKNTVDVSDTQSVNTTGADGAQKIEIKLNSSSVTGQVNSTVLTFVSGSPSLNELLCQFKGGDVGSYTALTTAYQEVDNSMPASSNANLDIQLTTPSSVSNDNYYDDYQFEIIVRATLL